jgi:hypothetical protein
LLSHRKQLASANGWQREKAAAGEVLRRGSSVSLRLSVVSAAIVCNRAKSFRGMDWPSSFAGLGCSATMFGLGPSPRKRAYGQSRFRSVAAAGRVTSTGAAATTGHGERTRHIPLLPASVRKNARLSAGFGGRAVGVRSAISTGSATETMADGSRTCKSGWCFFSDADVTTPSEGPQAQRRISLHHRKRMS